MAHSTPSDIERTSLGIIESELSLKGISLSEETGFVVKRVIHATADFDFAENLVFTKNACQKAAGALSNGTVIITDTNMALAGISKVALRKTAGKAACFMADPETAEEAKRQQTTRAAVSMQRAAADYQKCILAIGNAPTALLELCRLMEEGFRPSLVIAVPVGFVNVVEAKEKILASCRKYDIPCIAAMGRKGGSTVAAAICNALLYSACDLTEPEKRGWN